MNVKDYDTKVPESVRKQNTEKMQAYILDNQKLNEALKAVKKDWKKSKADL